MEIDSPLYPGKIIVKPFASSISDAGFLSIDDEVEEKEAASDDGNTNLLGLKVGLPCVIGKYVAIMSSKAFKEIF